MRLDNVIFQAGSAKIENTSYAELNDVVSMMQKNPKMIIQLEGHTDYAGSAKLNMKLSEDRVTSVKNYLTTQGINKNRIKTKAFGGTEPLSREDNEEARRLNRRVELRILQN
jgi:outer membrane protein OmpA-like peptidoglycan-associated protein